MGLARSTYYDEPELQPISEARLVEQIKAVCAEWPAYGYPGAIIIEVFDAPFSGAVAVFDDGDILLKRVARQHVLESLSGSKPRPFGGSLGAYVH